MNRYFADVQSASNSGQKIICLSYLWLNWYSLKINLDSSLCPECFWKGHWCNHSYWRSLLRGWKPVERAAIFWTPTAWTSLWSTLNTAAAAVSLQSCLTLYDPTDGSPPGSPVSGILQARTLEWLTFPSPMHESEKWKWSQSVCFTAIVKAGIPVYNSWMGN